MRRLLHPELRPDRPKEAPRLVRPPPFRADPRAALAWALASVAAATLAAATVFDVQERYRQELVEVLDERPGEVWLPVPAEDIPFGRRIEAEDLRLVPFRAALVPEHTLVDANQIVGRVAVERILAGDLVREERLAAPLAGEGINAVLPNGLRAKLLNLDPQRSLKGLLQPGSRVDILATVEEADGTSTTRTVLVDIKVLAVDDRLDRERIRTIKRKPGVLLELMPEEAELLTAAMHEGPVRLALVGEAEGPRDRKVVRR